MRAANSRSPYCASACTRLRVGPMFPAACSDAIFIAGHGSWNRSSKAGYRGVVMHVGKDGKVTGSRPFLTGFPDGRKTPGHPAGAQPLRGRSLRVPEGDDDVICRVTYAGSK